MGRPLLGLSLLLEKEFLNCTYPLFENGEVEILEWSFDTCWELVNIPHWGNDLLNCYSAENRLVGHGISLSLFSGCWSKKHEKWLELLKKECEHRQYRHLSEHFGFITDKSEAPLPVPITDDLLMIAEERLKRISVIANSPIGIENLAFSFGLQDVFSQGQFLGELLERVDGFLLLDLHNIYCQMVNFDLDAEQILSVYPLERVLEVHVSGGSWSSTNYLDKRCRRDTHDNAVPAEVFELLRQVLIRCQNVECIILERIGNTLKNYEETSQFKKDFQAIRKLVNESPYVRQ